MVWRELIEGLPIRSSGDNGNPHVDDVTYNSRVVKPGAVFVAIPGLRAEGDTYIHDAVQRGARAVISSASHPELTIPWVQVDEPRRILGVVARRLWGVDFNDFCMIGITGTNGKTTTAHLYHTLMKNKFGSSNAWMFGTIEYVLGEVREPAPNTTPEAADLIRHLGVAGVKPKGIVMEVSSHSLALHRVEGFYFDAAIWTNLTQDHLDFHKTMEAYYQAKKKLFVGHLKPSAYAVINIDDPYGRQLSNELSSSRVITFGYAADASVKITDAKTSWERTLVRIEHRGSLHSFTSALLGIFNVQNCAALIAGAIHLGYSTREIQECLTEVKNVSGRIERVAIDKPFTVVVDYAHTPDALIKILKALRSLTPGKVICVFGCGGDRDRMKRPQMAAAAANNSDCAIITSDNPRTEDPQLIIADIVRGIPPGFPYQVIADRVQAIRFALTHAERGDCVVIAGKGHEPYQEISGVRYPSDDREIVRSLCNERSGGI